MGCVAPGGKKMKHTLHMHLSKVTNAKLYILRVLGSILYPKTNAQQLIIIPLTVFQIMLAQCLIKCLDRVFQIYNCPLISIYIAFNFISNFGTGEIFR
jgi:hypothetical protein